MGRAPEGPGLAASGLQAALPLAQPQPAPSASRERLEFARNLGAGWGGSRVYKDAFSILFWSVGLGGGKSILPEEVLRRLEEVSGKPLGRRVAGS